MNKIFAAALIAATSVVHAIYDAGDNDEFPPLNVVVNDEEINLFVQRPHWSRLPETEEKRLVYLSQTRNYLSRAEKIAPQAYLTLNMLGGVMDYDVDMSNVDCGCTSTIYAVPMPFEENSKDPFQYCDGSGVYSWCQEFDIMSANKFAFQVSAKSEKFDLNNYCVSNVLDMEDGFAYGVGKDYMINTELPFHVRTEFHESEDQFIGYTTTLTQGDNEVVLKSGECHYLKSMSDAMKQMTFVLSQWGLNLRSDNDRLTHGVCDGTCDQKHSHSIFENLVFKTVSDPVSEPVDENEDDTVWIYGEKCGGLADGYCVYVDCAVCSWSWPSDSEFTYPEGDDPRSDCRCELEKKKEKIEDSDPVCKNPWTSSEQGQAYSRAPCDFETTEEGLFYVQFKDSDDSSKEWILKKDYLEGKRPSWLRSKCQNPWRHDSQLVYRFPCRFENKEYGYFWKKGKMDWNDSTSEYISDREWKFGGVRPSWFYDYL